MNNQSSLRKSLKSLALWILGAGLFVYAIVATGMYFDLKKKNSLTSETLAEVTESKSGSIYSKGKTHASTTIVYRYVVNGQEFTESSHKNAGDTSAYYPVGKNTAKACYDPKDPQDSEVETLDHVCGSISTNLLGMTAGFIVMMFLCFLIGSAIIIIYRKLRGRKDLPG